MRKTVLLITALFAAAYPLWAGSWDSTKRVMLDPVAVNDNNELFQDLYYTLAANAEKKTSDITLHISCFDITGDKDSILVYKKSGKVKVTEQSGVWHVRLSYADNEKAVFNSLYKEILIRNKSLPAGTYHTYLTLLSEDTIANTQLIRIVDSSLSDHSTAKKELETIYSPEPKKNFLGVIKETRTGSSVTNTYTTLKNSAKKIERLFSKKGYTVTYRTEVNATFVDLHYKGRYVGYYEVNTAQSISSAIKNKKENLRNNVTGLVKNELEDSRSIFDQLKKLNEENKKNEVQGTISVTGNASNGQEEYSQNENNYYEIAGQAEIPIMDIPVNVEGYYTSQDKHRIAKASYLRVHYDTEKAKSELLKLIAGYRNKYDETVAKGKGLKSVYGNYLENLRGQKDNLWKEVGSETGLTDISQYKTDTTGMLTDLIKACENKIKDSLTQKGDSIVQNNKTAAKLKSAKDTAQQLYEKAMDKYRKIQELEQKMQKYYTLLEQYENNNYFDSVLAYDKIKDLDNADGKTYKQLAKSASGLLPEGSAKKFITGLTNLDAGIISKDVSSYTLNGQTIKGADLGYDLGFCEAGFTYGRVEYVTRDGTVDKYKGYSVRTTFRPGENQKASLIYYGYMPSRKMLNETDFFKDVDVSMPAFKDPINIVSGTYTGIIADNVHVDAEAATSFRSTKEFKGEGTGVNDKLSYKLSADGNITGTGIDLKGKYEHVGKSFENNSLPLVLSGTDRYTGAVKASFFKNFLTVGVDYNYLVQQNLTSESSHSKWGFDIRTTSKRYPSVSLSYKPFTTFRSFTDTLNIPQRPIFGSVWTGKASYQIKKKTYVLRITAIYNRNTAMIDTNASNSNVAQLNVLYNKGKANLMLNLGEGKTQADNIAPAHSNVKFLNASAGYTWNSQWMTMAGLDLALASFGWSRYGTTLGCSYRFKRVPLMVRGNFRYNTYRVDESVAWKKIYSGMLDVTWNFKFKLNEKI